jgi:hypothetical protein
MRVAVHRFIIQKCEDGTKIWHRLEIGVHFLIRLESIIMLNVFNELTHDGRQRLRLNNVQPLRDMAYFL